MDEKIIQPNIPQYDEYNELFITSADQIWIFKLS